MWCNHQRQWYPVFHEQKTLLLYAKLFRLVNKKKMSEKEPKEWRKRRNAKLMRFILPFQWHQTIFFKCSSVYGFVFTNFFPECVIHRYHLLFHKQTNGVYAENLYASARHKMRCKQSDIFAGFIYLRHYHRSFHRGCF